MEALLAPAGQSRERFVPLVMTPRTARKDMIDQTERLDSIEPMEANEPTDRTEANDPMEPIDRNEPTDPIDRAEPFEAIERVELDDRIDQREPLWEGITGIFAEPAAFHIQRITPRQFHEADGVEDWRVLGEGACT
jgi:hypothetical protein